METILRYDEWKNAYDDSGEQQKRRERQERIEEVMAEIRLQKWKDGE